MRIKENQKFDANDYAEDNKYALIKDSNSHYMWATFSMVGAFIATSIGVTNISSVPLLGGIALLFALFLLYKVVYHFFTGNQKEAFNANAFVYNVNKKYNVGEVPLSAYGVTTSIERLELQKIHVIADGQAYLFYISQNPKTGEPTLSDPPINGGAHALTPTVSAKSLLRK